MASIPIIRLMILLLSITHIFGQDKFNPEKSVCCNGTIIDRGGIERPLCCGNVMYDLQKFLCCGDKLLPIPEVTDSDYNYGCCFDSKGEVKLVHHTTQQCCDGVPAEKPDPKSWYGCCNGQLYNETSHLCCNEAVAERLKDQECCVDRVFNTSIETCCKEWGRIPTTSSMLSWLPTFYQVFPHEGHRNECCGRGLYDPNTESCCENKIQPRPKDLPPGLRAACCNEEPYDPIKQRCCINGDVKDGKYVITGQKIHDNPAEESICCLLELYDPKKDGCCNSTIVPKPDGMDPNAWPTCCEGKVMNDKTHLCYFDKQVQRKDNDFHMDLCSKDQWYNRTSQTCCGGEILKPDEDCCWYSSRKFVKSEEICCNSEVLKLTEDDKLNGRSQCCMAQQMFGFHSNT